MESPDGRGWRVRRRWLDRPMPSLRRSFRKGREEAFDSPGLDSLSPLDVASPAIEIGGAVAVALIVLVLLPLLGVALELIALLVLLGSGLLGRVLLGRPWIVEAVPVGDPEERVVFAVKGWRRSSEALAELRTAVAAAGPPERIGDGEPLATRPQTRSR